MKLFEKIKNIKPKIDENISFIERIASFGRHVINLLNKIGSFFSNKILTVDNQEKLDDLGHFRGFQRSALLLRIIVFSFIAIVLWSIIAKTDQVVRGNGQVIPTSKIQLVQNAYGGVIDNILVKLSDDVKEGDILFEIDKDQSFINYQTTKEEVEIREEKLKIFEKLLESGSEAEITVINERITLSEAKRRLIDFENKYKNSLIKAPVDGKVSVVNVTTIGQVVSPGTLLAEIVPKNEALIIETQIAPKDIAKVKIGQKSKVAFTAFDSAIYGMFEGEVVAIAANTTYQEETGSIFYTVRVTVTDERLKDNERIIIQSGMDSMVSIISNKQRVISYLLNPIKKLSQKAFSE